MDRSWAGTVRDDSHTSASGDSGDTARPTAESAAGPTAASLGRVGGRSAKDMALSLLVLLLPIGLLVGFNRFVLDGEKPTVVDPAAAVSQARAAGLFPVDQPVGLGSDWRAVRADFRREENGATLRIGYLTPAGEGVQLVQSNHPAERLLATELTSAGRPQGTVDVAGEAWQRYSARPGERALVLLEPQRAIIVVGAAEESRLRELAAALRPA